ncbi:MAG: hypothetical protein NC925_04220, partial [Candidatus Omnitrophica bacterium]|nr:hypothetical protein [Candidatus Omnitrophota bacterium]
HRRNYVVHYMNLRTYLQQGLQLRYIHKVLRFKQSTFLKDFIDHTTNLRSQAKSSFDKSLYKLFINACFGKFIEQTRKYLNVRICHSLEKAAALIASPRFSNLKIITPNLVAVFLKQHTVQLNKAFPIGFTILERSKDFMYNQFYNVIRPKLAPKDVQVIFSDTDSFGLCITSANDQHPQENVLNCLKDIFDFSNYPETSPLYSTVNTAKLGLWKDELQEGCMLEFVGLRSKTYAFLVKQHHRWNDKTTSQPILQSKCKGVTKAYKKTLNFNAFKKCVLACDKTILRQFHIRSQNHVLKTISVEKLAFSSFDDKRYLLCPIHSVPYGSRFIKIAEDTKQCVFCNTTLMK